ncbi:MAG: hypothetical protein PHY93_05685 [Bacteriovorax sp.]|nr:hypothetical protein [Bacteriovorax sp.]
MKLMLLISLIIFNAQAFSEDLVFKLKGRPLEIVSLIKIKSGKLKFKSGDINATTVKLFNVFRGYERTYDGYAFYELLNLVYGKAWQQKEKLICTSSDSYHHIAVITPMIKSAKNNMGYIAFGEKGITGFTPIIKSGKKIDPGPLYLVWTNFTAKDRASHGDIIKWPYQLSEIDIE